jgi:cysteinyl-tRNA synthetase
MEALDDIVTAVNTYMTTATPKPQLLSRAATYVHSILKVFGVVAESAPSLSVATGESGKQLSDVLEAFCGLRDQLRALGAQTKLKELFEMCDDLRDRVFIDLGVKIEDDAKKSRWSLEDPATLRKELELKIQEKLEKQKKKAPK